MQSWIDFEVSFGSLNKLLVYVNNCIQGISFCVADCGTGFLWIFSFRPLHKGRIFRICSILEYDLNMTGSSNIFRMVYKHFRALGVCIRHMYVLFNPEKHFECVLQEKLHFIPFFFSRVLKKNCHFF